MYVSPSSPLKMLILDSVFLYIQHFQSRYPQHFFLHNSTFSENKLFQWFYLLISTRSSNGSLGISQTHGQLGEIRWVAHTDHRWMMHAIPLPCLKLKRPWAYQNLLLNTLWHGTMACIPAPAPSFAACFHRLQSTLQTAGTRCCSPSYWSYL